MEILLGIGCIVGALIIVGASGILLVAGAKRVIDELNAEIDRR